MSFKKLVNPGAFGQGADLWIIPDPESSPWARKIDWYLNLQMLRAKSHTSQKLASHLTNILKDNEIKLTQIKVDRNAPLLINSRDHLPTRSVLHVPINDNAKAWIDLCFKTWQNLNEPTVRFFLPASVSDDVFENNWPKDKQAGVSYVSGQSPLDE